jgi:hypothetical protein
MAARHTQRHNEPSDVERAVIEPRAFEAETTQKAINGELEQERSLEIKPLHLQHWMLQEQSEFSAFHGPVLAVRLGNASQLR